jgi:hypothetical protein
MFGHARQMLGVQLRPTCSAWTGSMSKPCHICRDGLGAQQRTCRNEHGVVLLGSRCSTTV